jgi:hypothetical protein
MAKQPAKEGEKRALPDSYSAMYPGRFLKADMLKGAKVTLTIKNITGEGLMGGEGDANLEWVVSFAERPLEFVMNKTNAFCLYRMFGGDPHSWIGRRITLYPTTTMAFGSKHDCLRVWGSPDLAEDLKISVRQGRKTAEVTLHKVAAKASGASEAVAPSSVKPSRDGLDPRILAGLGLLSPEAGDKFLLEHASYGAKDMLAALNTQLDQS